MKKFFVSTVMALASVGSSAQVETTPVELNWGNMCGIPEIFSYDKYLVIENQYSGRRYFFDIYDADLNSVKSIKSAEKPLPLKYYNFDSGAECSYNAIFLTQRLFNDDEKFEYVVGIEGNYDVFISGFKIVSEDGEVLQTVTFEKFECSSKPEIIKIGDNIYLAFLKDDSKHILYKINKSADPSKVSVAKVPVRVNVSPRLVERSQDITVVTEGQEIREVVVTDAAGKIVYSTKAAAGEKTVKINSHYLSSGMNVVSVKSADGKNENCKVIVKK